MPVPLLCEEGEEEEEADLGWTEGRKKARAEEGTTSSLNVTKIPPSADGDDDDDDAEASLGIGTESGDQSVRRKRAEWAHRRGNEALIKSARIGVGRGRYRTSERRAERWASSGVGLFRAHGRGRIVSILCASRERAPCSTVQKRRGYTHVEEEKKKGVEEAARVDSSAVKTCLAAEMI